MKPGHTAFDINLECINAYLCSDSYALIPWSHHHIKTLELLYRRFLHLIVTHPTIPLTPSRCIDEYWHAHILHTRRYIDDCTNIAGRYIHHHPDDSRNPDPESLKVAFQNTCDLYEQTFGEPLVIFKDD